MKYMHLGLFLCLLLSQIVCASEVGKENLLELPQIDKEAAEKIRSELNRVDKAHLGSDFEGGLLFEGTVTRYLGTDRYGQREWNVRVDDMFYAHPELPHSANLAIASPRKRNSGYSLRLKQRYKMYATYWDKMPIGSSGRYFIWNGTVIPLPAKGKSATTPDISPHSKP